MGTAIRVRRVYEEPSPEDGARVLVDRVWPRGMRKEAARLDEWAKDVAPSAELRTWYRHDPAKFDEFRRRYTAELAQPGAKEALARLRVLAADRAGDTADRHQGPEPQPGRRPRRSAAGDDIAAGYRVPAGRWRSPGWSRAVRRATHRL